MQLNEWAQVFRLNPYAFNQLRDATGELLGYDHRCGVWYELGWQFPSQVARQEVARAIQDAERMIARFVGFHPTWKFTIDEEHTQETHFAGIEDYGYGAYGKRKTLQLNFKHVVSSGGPGYTPIVLGAPVVADSLDADAFEEAFTVGPISLAGVDWSYGWQLGLYFRQVDRYDAAPISEDWRILPIRQVYDPAANEVTFHGMRYQLVDPILQWGINPQPLDINTADSFVTKLDVMLLGPNSNKGGAYWYEEEECAQETQDICFNIQSSKQGFIVPIVGPSCSASRQPDRFRVNYLSGARPDDSGNMAYPWSHIVAYLSAALLGDRMCCECDQANKLLELMRQDMQDSKAAAGRSARWPTVAEQSCPFGTKYGAIEAWKMCIGEMDE